MTHTASKVIIVTEKLILKDVAHVIEQAGATGYTVIACGGKGSRGVRTSGPAAVVDDFSNIKIEVITAKREAAEKIANIVAEQFFDDYSGITYIENVEILRPHKF
jgi:nitrogen regulatory protein PII